MEIQKGHDVHLNHEASLRFKRTERGLLDRDLEIEKCFL